MQINEDSLKSNDLVDLVDKVFEIDNYKSKMGDDADVVVLSFTVESKAPAEDLVGFIEKGYGFVLDADMTPGELDDGKYRVFVELQRNHTVVENITELLYGISKLTGFENFKFRYHKNFDSQDATSDKLEEIVPTNPRMYQERLSQETPNNYQEFFGKSMLESLKVNGDVIEFKKIYADPLKFKIYSFGSTQNILESIEDRIAVGMNDLADIMFLTKYIGNYNITKLGNKYMFENKGHALILEKI